MLPVVVYIVATIVAMISILWWRTQQWRKKLPPGPPCYPIIGNIGTVNVKDTLSEFARLRKLYGDVFCFVIGTSPVIILNGSEAIRDLFVKEGESLAIRPPAFLLSKISNWKGIVTSNGHRWKEQRAFALKTLRDFGFGKRSLELRVQQEVEEFLRCLESSKGKPFDFLRPLKVSIANVICSISMGRRYEFDDERLFSLMEMVNKLITDPSTRGPAAFVPFGRYIPGDPLHVKMRENVINYIINFLREIIEEHKSSLDETMLEITQTLF